MLKITDILSLLSKLDSETSTLFFSFIQKAKQSSDLNVYLKGALKRALEDVQVVSVKPSKKIKAKP